MNPLEILQKHFCAPDFEIRDYLKAPLGVHGHVVASDNRWMGVLNHGHLAGQVAEVPYPETRKNFMSLIKTAAQALETSDWIRADEVAIDYISCTVCGGTGKCGHIECSDCDGSGECPACGSCGRCERCDGEGVIPTRGQGVACVECGGTGTQVDQAVTCLGGTTGDNTLPSYSANGKYIERLRAIGGEITTSTVQDERVGAVFVIRWPTGYGVLMPMKTHIKQEAAA